MLTETETEEILQVLSELPPEKIAEVKDFAEFLHSRENAQEVDESDEWSDEDLRDFTASSRFAELNTR